MPWCDFKGIWKVTAVNPTSRETQDHLIAIGGQMDNVFIYCLDNSAHHGYKHTYKAGGTYSSADDSINGPAGDAFKITRNGSVLTFVEPSRPVGGSWIANDTLPWHGEGGK